MSTKAVRMKAVMVILSCFVVGCSLSEQNAQKTAPVSFITTPASYYSTPKARYLGEKYKDNLDRLAARIVRDPKTADLQFANNISSVGGIGFFTHSATKTVDERYLEVIVSAPETFDKKEAFNDKVARIFGAYGTELLSILAGDTAISQDPEVSGYGLNLTWRSIVQSSTGSRIVLESAVLYFTKKAVRAFLHQDMAQNTLLAKAVIFGAKENAPMTLISSRRPDSRRDTRLPIHEEALPEPQMDAAAEARHLAEEPSKATRETTSSIAAANDKGSTPNGPAVPVAAAGRHAAASAGPQQIADHKPTRPLQTAQPASRSKIAATTSIAKQANKQSDLQKAERQGHISQASKPDGLHQLKPAGDEPKVASAGSPVPENSVRGTQIPNVATASQPRPPHAVSGSAETPGKEKKATKATTHAQPLTVKTAQAGAQKESERLPREQTALERRSSVADSHEKGRDVTGASAGQASRADMVKPLVNPVAKNPTPHDSQNGRIIAAAPLSTPADKPPRGKDRAAVTVAESGVKGPSVAPRRAASTAKDNSPATGGELSNERVALLKNTSDENAPENRASGLAHSKVLEGFVIQVGFNNKNAAQRWAETLERRGYAVSVTQAGGTGLVRLRLGNFSVREEAEKQLKSLNEEGLTGIVINLPQAYRPAMRLPPSDASQTQTARTDN